MFVEGVVGTGDAGSSVLDTSLIGGTLSPRCAWSRSIVLLVLHGEPTNVSDAGRGDWGMLWLVALPAIGAAVGATGEGSSSEDIVLEAM